MTGLTVNTRLNLREVLPLPGSPSIARTDSVPLADETGIEDGVSLFHSTTAGTILLTGTPAEVLFHPATIWTPLAHLHSSEEVLMRAPSLGVLRNAELCRQIVEFRTAFSSDAVAEIRAGAKKLGNVSTGACPLDLPPGSPAPCCRPWLSPCGYDPAQRSSTRPH